MRLRWGNRSPSRRYARPLQAARWIPWRLDDGELSMAADVASAGYVLGELSPDAASPSWSDAMARAAPLVVLIEPGTPAGFARIIAARDALIGSGHTIVAPCPHERACPLLANARLVSLRCAARSVAAASRGERRRDVVRRREVLLRRCEADGGAVGWQCSCGEDRATPTTAEGIGLAPAVHANGCRSAGAGREESRRVVSVCA